MAVGGAAGGGVPLGLQLAGALTASPDGISHLILPMILQGTNDGVLVISLAGH
jgi:hypothetical protein